MKIHNNSDDENYIMNIQLKNSLSDLGVYAEVTAVAMVSAISVAACAVFSFAAILAPTAAGLPICGKTKSIYVVRMAIIEKKILKYAGCESSAGSLMYGSLRYVWTPKNRHAHANALFLRNIAARGKF